MKITANFGDAFNPNKIREQMKGAIRAKLTFPGAEKLTVTIEKDFSVSLDGPDDLLAKASEVLKDAKL